MRKIISREQRSAKNVKAVRERANMSQEQFAGETGVAANTISRIETGASPLSADTALKINKRFSVSMDYLFGFSSYEEGGPPCEKTCDKVIQAQLHIDMQDAMIKGLTGKLEAITEVLAGENHKTIK